MTAAQHIVNISGGKDSTATYLLAIERGRPFRAVWADTGHEAPQTYDFIAGLPEAAGGPPIERVAADFAARIERKRMAIEEKWPRDGVPAEQVARALKACRPTGNPFLDLCILKGLFPSPRARFCTEELKHIPIVEQIIKPALARGPVIQWTGERAEESPRRAALPMFQRVRWDKPRGVVAFWRPILKWTAGEVFALHHRHGVAPNPLYLKGMGRVGCFPCIMARKGELAAIAGRYPEAFERLQEWENIVTAASKRGRTTFFGPDKAPEGVALAAVERETGVMQTYPDAMTIADWARTSRGGRQFDMLSDMDASAACSSQYGLCE